MKNKDIYQDTIPYFYIIQHRGSGKKYAGARWAKGCHPSELLTDFGYHTSSNTILEMILVDGLDAFDILEIVTDTAPLSVYEYETKFLVDNQCNVSDAWLNQHNNECRGGIPFGSDAFNNLIVNRYNVQNVSQLDSVKNKKVQTSLANRGVENPSQCEEVKRKKEATYFAKTGYTYSFSNPEVREAMQATNMEKYGVPHTGSAEVVKQKIKGTCMSRYGCENPYQSEGIKQKIKIANLEKYGVEYCSQRPEVKAKVRETNIKSGLWPAEKKQKPHRKVPELSSKSTKEKIRYTNIEKWGPKRPVSREEINARARQTNILKYGVANPSSSDIIKEKKRNNILEKKSRPSVVSMYQLIDEYNITNAYTIIGLGRHWSRKSEDELVIGRARLDEYISTL